MFGQGHLAGSTGAQKAVQGDVEIGIGMGHRQEMLQVGDLQIQFFPNLADHSTLGRLPFFQLATGEFVLVGDIIVLVLSPLHAQDLIFNYNNRCRHFDMLHDLWFLMVLGRYFRLKPTLTCTGVFPMELSLI